MTGASDASRQRLSTRSRSSFSATPTTPTSPSPARPGSSQSPPIGDCILLRRGRQFVDEALCLFGDAGHQRGRHARRAKIVPPALYRSAVFLHEVATHGRLFEVGVKDEAFRRGAPARAATPCSGS